MRTMATMATGSEISNKMPSRGFINVASPMCSLAHKTTPDTGCTQIKANVQRVPFLCVRAKAKLITKLTLCQTRNNETNRPDTRPGRRHTFLPFPIPLPLPIPLSFLNSSLSALQLLRLNCQHPGEQQQRAVVKAVAPRAMPPHLQLPRNHFVCVFNASGVDCYNNIAHRADLRL